MFMRYLDLVRKKGRFSKEKLHVTPKLMKRFPLYLAFKF